MGKLLLLVAVVFGLVLWWKHEKRGRASPGSNASPPAGPAPAEVMVRCTHCGVHLPQSQALPGPDGHFCSAEHRERHEASS
jgi:uncharacterized protein